MSIILKFIEKIKTTYLPAYFQWLTEKLSDTEPFAVLSVAVIVIFILVIYIWYIWFRNRE